MSTMLSIRNSMAAFKFVKYAHQQIHSIGGKVKFSNFSPHRLGSVNVKQISKNRIPDNGPGLKDFLIDQQNVQLPNIMETESIPYLNPNDYSGNGRKVYFEVYGCQMNVSDTEIVWSILKNVDYEKVDDIKDADVVLIMTCSIREGAESKIWHRLKHVAAIKRDRGLKKGPYQVGVLGCMAERLKNKLLEKEKTVDLVAGPDSYKDLPRLLAVTKNGQTAVNVLLSLEETYADVMPIRLNSNSVSAFVSIMRGCDNMCTYCIVPFTRGRERSRPMKSIENEVYDLAAQGIKEITLLGQNVNSYRDLTSNPNNSNESKLPTGFKTVYKPKLGGARFAELLECVAVAAPQTRIRFTSPHPKDFSDDVLNVIMKYPNICNSIHLPVQSGSTSVLERMRRGYTREAYLELVDRIRSKIPDIALSSDFICGFCDETDQEFADTISIIEKVQYNMAYLFQYSMREKTTAFRRYQDNVPVEIKNARLIEMTNVYRKEAAELNRKFVGEEQTILIEGPSKRSTKQLFGRNYANIKVIVPLCEVAISSENVEGIKLIEAGDFLKVRITDSNSQTLKGVPLCFTQLNSV